MGADDGIMLIRTKIFYPQSIHALKTLIKMQFPFPGNITVMDMILMAPATSWHTPFIRDQAEEATLILMRMNTGNYTIVQKNILERV